MKKLFLIVFLIFSTVNLYAQDTANEKIPFPATYVITTDTISHNTFLPDSCWQMIADPSGKMKLEQIMQPGIFKDTIRKINYKNNVFWLRYRIANSMQKEAKITLRVNTTGNETSRSDLYIKTDSSKWEHLKTGQGVPWSERDGLKRFYYINVVIPAGKEITVYEKDKMNYFLYPFQNANTTVSFGFTETIIKNDYISEDFHYIPAVEYAFLLGLFVLALVINFYFFIIVREKEFLYFTLFLLASALSNLYYLQDLIFREYPRLQAYLSMLSGFFIFFFLIFFVRHFLKTFKRFPRWDRWLIILAYTQVAIDVFLIILPSLVHNNFSILNQSVAAILMIIVFFSLLITFLLYIRSHDRAIKLMIIAVSPFIFLYVVLFLSLIVWEILQSGFGAKSTPAFITFIFSNFNLAQTISYLWMVLAFSWVLFLRFSSLRKKMAMQEVEKEKERNALIVQQKIELEKQVAERTSELKHSLEELKSTQSQLIQSEKMASLGELTAGIAHEIQNPLNFVNNFSEVNKEMLEELKAERRKPNAEKDDGLQNDLINDVIENSEKIIHHGKRADAIVKGMLQHSRQSSGKKEPTDINALCDEYLRLSYHGMRAKDKEFNATMKTEFDESIEKINIVPQDIGRVLLNLFNNAFYACAERSRSTVNEQKIGNSISYEPTVTVKTSRNPPRPNGSSGQALGGREAITITITVSDNGPGIPQKIKDKIFQPFFTTKPTGSGTGLGLSLSYDIVKAHGGEIKISTKEGEFTEFIIQLPVKTI